MKLTTKERDMMNILKEKTSADLNTFMLVYRDKKYAKTCLQRFVNMFKILEHTTMGRFKINHDTLNKLLNPALVKPFDIKIKPPEKNSTLKTNTLEEDFARIEAYNQAIMNKSTCGLIDLIRDKQEQITCIQMELYRRQMGSGTL